MDKDLSTLREILIAYENFKKMTSETFSCDEQAIDRFIEDQPKEKLSVEKIIEQVEDMHPYKESGNRDSFSEYNEGWSDACDILGNRILELFSDQPKEKVSEEDEIMNEHEIEEYLQEWLFNYNLQSKTDFSYAELHQLVEDLLNHLNK
jgi:hypothetical protein